MRVVNAYWVKVNGKMVTRTGAELVEMYRNEVERNDYKENLTTKIATLEAALTEAREELVAAANRNILLREELQSLRDEGAVVSKSQHDLQQFVTEEVKRQLVAAIKLGGIINGR